mmetsp:Transcript_9357/g.14034  ORF Transcript_9357/g.14034 Transcript_9357/m.14034 type:complete len:352 (-) Transcript_9357:253-1308(-)
MRLAVLFTVLIAFLGISHFSMFKFQKLGSQVRSKFSLRNLGAARRAALIGGMSIASAGSLTGIAKTSAKREGICVRASSEDKNLLIIGCGTLGERLGRSWKVEYPEATVVGETRGETRHASFEQHGIRPRLFDSAEAKSGEQFQNVVFSAPPSSSGNYVEELKRAVNLWDKSGMLVFTSSGGSYLEEDGGIVSEGSPTKDPDSSPRTKILLDSEKVVLDAGGCVVRLAGLYTLQRGAHSYWLQRGQVSGSPEGLINLIHYDDAASLVMTALKAGKKSEGQIFLGSDDKPMSRQEICEAAMRHPSYSARFQMPTFTGIVGSKGKRYDSKFTRDRLSWQPKYASFDDFIDNDN